MASAPLFISLIVPVYNVASTIEECVRSILSQLPEDGEIVCVDDGSTDDSIQRIHQIVSEYPEAASRVRFIEQKNRGLSEARNTGISRSAGRYIGLLDSDDLLQPGYFDRIREVVETYPDVSIVCFNADRFGVRADGQRWREPLQVHAGEGSIVPSMPADFDKLARNFASGRWFAWARVYERGLFDGYEFKPGFKYQDMLLLPELYLRANRIVNLSDTLVDYRIHGQSVTARPNQSTLENLDAIIKYYHQRTFAIEDRLEGLRHLVILACLESVFHAAKKAYGPMRGQREFRKRQRELGKGYIAGLLLQHAFRYPHQSALMHLTPSAYLVYKKICRLKPASSPFLKSWVLS